MFETMRWPLLGPTLERNEHDDGGPAQATLAAFVRHVWDEGDADAADIHVANTYMISHDPGDPREGQALDRAGFKGWVRPSRTAFPDRSFDIHALFAEGDGVVMACLRNGTNRGDLPGFPATHRIIRMSGATVYGFDKEDRLTEHWQIADQLGVFQQIQRNM